jgi:hypothetical protein
MDTHGFVAWRGHEVLYANLVMSMKAVQRKYCFSDFLRKTIFGS